MANSGHGTQEHCNAYCQNQIGNADPHFSSNFPIERRYGFFSNLRPHALPLMIQAGKYLGKRLLTSGRNIVEDMSQRKPFRDAARDQMRQSGREITTDILRKLRGGGARKAVRRKKSMRQQAKEIEFTRRLFHSLSNQRE
ncbi:hypothetical protein AVEN_86129-1 [Araneus ventricosus]|uniref:Uncharacterized protein n=1 Tax=Araneus ventricosus TaxID=182803 RepID=A0A4Y2P7H0_ARAVE|nr:hypothetical protein AVEN_86129-1 [Araneus ventricosus]